MALAPIQNYQPRMGLASGAAADTATAVTCCTGETIDTDDTLISVLHNTSGTIVDVTSEASISADGYIKLSTTDTSNDQLIVWFHDATI